ncbi:nucleotidyltransferase domain-containing protein [Picosynechococcus sp. PCC 11901]|uniref:nucleotidyltransferase family protein n=1 Tax=Picosynechococcus sp. PCC 11901 TaxID=2579791 RepID=UPI0010FC3193|nr:nucleotidyltransferase domain-containing protein [Picosynechococcus sp. PCC 11901]QCS50613.1 nucleotidyltransferase domain-containing protein [Picosynechococcus sp. PCC 11901]
MIRKDLIQDKNRLEFCHQTALKNLPKNYEFKKDHQQNNLYLAKQAAIILKEKFNASKVALFGSILDLETFTQWSDIDIAAWGLEPSETLLAMDTVQSLSDEIEINLVDINTVKSEVYQNILKNHQEI